MIISKIFHQYTNLPTDIINLISKYGECYCDNLDQIFVTITIETCKNCNFKHSQLYRHKYICPRCQTTNKIKCFKKCNICHNCIAKTEDIHHCFDCNLVIIRRELTR